MARIKSKNTSPEVLLRKVLWQKGLRYRLHYKIEKIKPDMVFIKARVVVFIDGCFWHGCPDHYVRPRSNNEKWDNKLLQNTLRDRRQTITLENAGWTVLRFWEHEIFTELERVASTVSEALVSSLSGHQETRWIVVRVECLDQAKDTEKWFLEDLRDGSINKTEIRRRSTRKW